MDNRKGKAPVSGRSDFQRNAAHIVPPQASLASNQVEDPFEAISNICRTLHLSESQIIEINQEIAARMHRKVSSESLRKLTEANLKVVRGPSTRSSLSSQAALEREWETKTKPRITKWLDQHPSSVRQYIEEKIDSNPNVDVLIRDSTLVTVFEETPHHSPVLHLRQTIPGIQPGEEWFPGESSGSGNAVDLMEVMGSLNRTSECVLRDTFETLYTIDGQLEMLKQPEDVNDIGSERSPWDENARRSLLGSWTAPPINSSPEISPSLRRRQGMEFRKGH